MNMLLWAQRRNLGGDRRQRTKEILVWVETALIGTLAVLAERYTKYRKATLGTIEEVLLWTANTWSAYSPEGEGCDIFTVIRWGHVGAIGIKDEDGNVLYRIDIKVRFDRICVEARGSSPSEATQGKIYAFLPFVNAGLNVMGVSELKSM